MKRFSAFGPSFSAGHLKKKVLTKSAQLDKKWPGLCARGQTWDIRTVSQPALTLRRDPSSRPIIDIHVRDETQQRQMDWMSKKICFLLITPGPAHRSAPAPRTVSEGWLDKNRSTQATRWILNLTVLYFLCLCRPQSSFHVFPVETGQTTIYSMKSCWSMG